MKKFNDKNLNLLYLSVPLFPS